MGSLVPCLQALLVRSARKPQWEVRAGYRSFVAQRWHDTDSERSISTDISATALTRNRPQEWLMPLLQRRSSQIGLVHQPNTLSPAVV